MKQLYIILLFTTISTASFSQTYKPMLKENKIWFGYEDVAGQQLYPIYYMATELNGDTIIQNKKYYKYRMYNAINNPLFSTPNPPVYDPDVFGSYLLFREDTLSKQVWCLDAFNGYVENIIYDFSLVVGDTMTAPDHKFRDAHPGPLYGGQPITIHKAIIDSIKPYTLFNGDTTRAFYLSPINFGTLESPLFVIEGVGSLKGFHNPFSNEFEYAVNLACMREGGLATFGNCPNTTLLNINNSQQKEILFNIHPNPSKNQITVTLNKPKSGSYIVISSLGKMVLEGKINSTQEFELNLNESSGIYFIQLIVDNKAITKKIVIN